MENGMEMGTERRVLVNHDTKLAMLPGQSPEYLNLFPVPCLRMHFVSGSPIILPPSFCQLHRKYGRLMVAE